jgi:hypothetical protein
MIAFSSESRVHSEQRRRPADARDRHAHEAVGGQVPREHLRELGLRLLDQLAQRLRLFRRRHLRRLARLEVVAHELRGDLREAPEEVRVERHRVADRRGAADRHHELVAHHVHALRQEDAHLDRRLGEVEHRGVVGVRVAPVRLPVALVVLRLQRDVPVGRGGEGVGGTDQRQRRVREAGPAVGLVRRLQQRVAALARVEGEDRLARGRGPRSDDRAGVRLRQRLLDEDVEGVLVGVDAEEGADLAGADARATDSELLCVQAHGVLLGFGEPMSSRSRATLAA